MQTHQTKTKGKIRNIESGFEEKNRKERIHSQFKIGASDSAECVQYSVHATQPRQTENQF